MKKVTLALILLILFWRSSFAQDVSEIQFTKVDTSLNGCEFVYSNYQSSKYLDSLRKTFKIDKVVEGCKTDFERVLSLLNWTSSQWKHVGSNEPKKGDAISILLDVRKGERFRCVEYGIVLAATLNSIGVTARTVGLKTKDVETTKSGAGHVAAEVYMNDLNKWIFVDPQWNIVPILNDLPLNAVELNRVMCTNPLSVKYVNKRGVVSPRASKKYTNWIAPYLYYFDAAIDNRYFTGKFDRAKCKGKKVLMLVPMGAKNPAAFQINTELNWCTYTNNIELYYGRPKIVN